MKSKTSNVDRREINGLQVVEERRTEDGVVVMKVTAGVYPILYIGLGNLQRYGININYCIHCRLK